MDVCVSRRGTINYHITIIVIVLWSSSGVLSRIAITVRKNNNRVLLSLDYTRAPTALNTGSSAAVANRDFGNARGAGWVRNREIGRK